MAPIGMINHPVQLGVNKNTYSEKKTSCVKIEVVWRPHD